MKQADSIKGETNDKNLKQKLKLFLSLHFFISVLKFCQRTKSKTQILEYILSTY